MKPFKETKIGKFINSKGVDAVLGIAGDVIPGVKILDTIKDAVLNGKIPDTMLSEDEKKMLLQMVAEHQAELDAVLCDVKDARSREIEMAKAGKSDWMQKVVIGSGIFFFALIVYASVFIEIPESNKIMFAEIRATLVTVYISIVGYYVGSTLGSKRKSDTLDTLLKK